MIRSVWCKTCMMMANTEETPHGLEVCQKCGEKVGFASTTISASMET